MRTAPFFGFLLAGFAALFLIPAVTIGQPGGFGGKGSKGGGGFSPFGGGMMMQGDPSQIFDFLSRGRGFFLLTDTRSLRDPLTKYAQEKGITNGQVTKAQFLDFYEGFKAKVAAPAPAGGGTTPTSPMPVDGGKGGFKLFGGPGGGMVPPGVATNPDAINEWADKEFQRRDSNGDGRLVREEMPASLRDNLGQWDKNSDGFINISEFREYFRARISGGTDKDSNNNNAAKGIASIIIEDDELDRKPTVFRVGGKMPAGLPSWFKELDQDNDGQVAFAEWRKAGKNLDEFREWDLNDDGLITPDEAVRHYATLGNASKTGPGIASTPSNSERPSFGGKGAFGGFSGFGGFGKGKKGDRQDR